MRKSVFFSISSLLLVILIPDAEPDPASETPTLIFIDFRGFTP
ncbi:MAG: hypothetical protein ACFFCV_00620 [Promethearchaeota archaeon]